MTKFEHLDELTPLEIYDIYKELSHLDGNSLSLDWRERLVAGVELANDRAYDSRNAEREFTDEQWKQTVISVVELC